MGIDTRNLAPSLSRGHVLWAKDFDWILVAGPPPALVSSVDATVIRQDVSTFGATGALMNNNDDAVTALYTVPPDCDVIKPIYVRVLWSSLSQTAADTVLWKVFYKLISLDNDALSATISTPLNTVIGTDTVGSTTAGMTRATDWGVINPGSITNIGCIVQLLLEMDAKAVGLTEDLYALGIEFAYHRLVKKGGRGPTLVKPTA